MLDWTLSRNEKATTTEATAKTTHDIDSNNGLKLRRPSRKAMRQTHGENKAFIV
jgi:hypothetical protein